MTNNHMCKGCQTGNHTPDIEDELLEQYDSTTHSSANVMEESLRRSVAHSTLVTLQRLRERVEKQKEERLKKYHEPLPQGVSWVWGAQGSTEEAFDDVLKILDDELKKL